MDSRRPRWIRNASSTLVSCPEGPPERMVVSTLLPVFAPIDPIRFSSSRGKNELLCSTRVALLNEREKLINPIFHVCEVEALNDSRKKHVFMGNIKCLS